jgi:creatinine amidohydrolase
MSAPRRTAPVPWAALTWEEIGRLPPLGRDAAILPVGATEQHGRHLGTGMDSALADRLCAEVGARTQVPVLPLLPYGCSLGHSRRWPGTISLSPQTLISLVCDLGDWVWAAGFRRLFIVNAHVTNAAPLRCALEVLRSRHDGFMLAVVNTATLSPRVERAFRADGGDWHANAAETSLMLALAPALVRPRTLRAADDPDRTKGLVFAHPVNRTSRDGATGLPSRARAAAGRRLFGWMAADLTALVRRGLREKAPLDFSYHEPTSIHPQDDEPRHAAAPSFRRSRKANV